MLKRTVSLLLTLFLVLSLCITAFAEGLPFDSIEGAPERLHFLFSYPNEGSESIEVVFLVPNDICELKAKSSQEQEKYYGSAYECCVQYDWAIDSDKAWNYDASWDTLDGSYPFQRLTGSFVEKQELFWFTYDEAAERCKGAVKSEQKETEVEDSFETVTVRRFDFDNHKLYVRARFFIYEYSTGTCFTGDWSDIYCVNDFFSGKKAPDEYKGDDEGVSPVISSVRLSDGNTFSFDVSFDDSTKEQAYLLKCSGNPDFTIESQVRIDGGKWDYWITGNELYPYVVGTRSLKFTDSQLQSKIEYRCRLIFNEVNDLPAYKSGWSDLIVIENGEAVLVENDDPFDKRVQEDVTDTAKNDKCGVCGFCPFHPFGVCMFIWIGIIVLIVLIVVYNVIMVKKKKKQAAETLLRQEAARNSDKTKEESIINIDLTPKIKENTSNDTNVEEGGK